MSDDIQAELHLALAESALRQAEKCVVQGGVAYEEIGKALEAVSAARYDVNGGTS